MEELNNIIAIVGSAIKNPRLAFVVTVFLLVLFLYAKRYLDELKIKETREAEQKKKVEDSANLVNKVADSASEAKKSEKEIKDFLK